MILKNWAAALAVIFSAGAASAAETYAIDNAHSTIGFSVRHIMVSSVKGAFKDYSGSVVYDDKDIAKSSVKLAIKTASIDTGIDKRDSHLRSADFLEADKYPAITFESTKIA